MFSVPILYSRLAENPAVNQFPIWTITVHIRSAMKGLLRFEVIKKDNNAQINCKDEKIRFTEKIMRLKESLKSSKWSQIFIPLGRGHPVFMLPRLTKGVGVIVETKVNTIE